MQGKSNVAEKPAAAIAIVAMMSLGGKSLRLLVENVALSKGLSF